MLEWLGKQDIEDIDSERDTGLTDLLGLGWTSTETEKFISSIENVLSFEMSNKQTNLKNEKK